jgi:type VI secretion system protein ImpC
MDRPRGFPDPDTPFRILIMGDFTGRANRGIFDPCAALAPRRIHLVDRDNLDEIMNRLGVEILLPLAGDMDPPVVIRFAELDDFHPDQIFEHLALFKEIKETRKKLSDPSCFAKAAAELQKKEGNSASPVNTEGTEESLRKLSQQTTADLLDQMLDDSPGSVLPPASNRVTSEWDGFLKRIVQPYLVPDVEQVQDEFLTAVDTATGELMRAILHYPEFQELEAAWRGLQFLISRMESDDLLQLYLLDISKAELTADLGSSDDLRATGTFRLLVEQTVETPGAEPWALLAGNYAFGGNREEAEMLGRMAKIAGAAGAPFIAAAGERLSGCELLAKTADPESRKHPEDAEESRAWETLRKQPEASSIGLALPRFMLRLPYGEETDQIERFEFEEMEARPDHDHYLWGNPSFVCACLLAQSFSEYGWEMRPGIIQEIEDLPLHVYKEQGESRIKPCAEVLLTEVAAEGILEKGLMPLLSFKNRDTVRVARFHSVADPPASLAGRWDKGFNQ